MSFATAQTVSRGAAPLTRRSHAVPPAVQLWEQVALALARTHELCGKARRTLALHVAAAAKGAPVIWIAPHFGADALHLDGVAEITAPHDLLFVQASRPDDVLWAMEEALRSGVAPVVVGDLGAPPGMVPVRRLHLAAQAGAQEGRTRPLGLLLTPGQGGAPGIETRWQMEPAHLPGRDRWRVERTRARMAPPQGWWLEAGRLQPCAA